MLIASCFNQPGTCLTPPQGAFWQELRLDTPTSLHLLNPAFATNRHIITWRHPAQGGLAGIDATKRADYYLQLVKGSNCLIDIELTHYFANRQLYAKLPLNRVILSHHAVNFADIPIKMFDEALKLNPYWLKLAVAVNTYHQLLQLKRLANNYKRKLLLAPGGNLGPLGRMLYRWLGSPACYVSQGEQTGQGQLSLQQALLLNIASTNRRTVWGGLVSNKYIWDSAGITYYHRRFRQAGLNACYLPFMVNNPTGFWQFINSLPHYGFSVTMPFKTDFARICNSKLPAVNLVAAGQKASNTDLDAFKAALKQLKLCPASPTVIYGNGASAQTALIALAGYKQVYIATRNQASAIAFAHANNCQLYQGQPVEAIINCTPASYQSFTNNINCANGCKVIDLNYRNSYHMGQQQVFTGHSFWQAQAKKQLRFFMANMQQDFLL